MTAAACSDEKFVQLFESVGPTQTAKQLGVTVRNVLARRARLEVKLGRKLESPYGPGGSVKDAVERGRRIDLKITDGVVIVGSDAHYKDGVITCAHRAAVLLAHELQIKAFILNGDGSDFPAISSHGRIGWATPTAVRSELQALDERLSEIREAAPERCELLFNWGNHDIRFDTYLAKNAAAFEGVRGFSLPDHLPHWRFAWTVWINNEVVVKHRWKGGIHATHNNTVGSGKSIVTGHLHALKVTPFADFNGNRFGVDSGTMADPDDEQFDYTEDNPTNWRSGFVVLTFHKGRLLWPEIVHVLDKCHVEFRGKVIKV